MKLMIGEDTFARLDEIDGDIVLTVEDEGKTEHTIWLDGPTQSKLLMFIADCSHLRLLKSHLELDAAMKRPCGLRNGRNQRVGIVQQEDAYFVVKLTDYDNTLQDKPEWTDFTDRQVLLHGVKEFDEAVQLAEEEARHLKFPLDASVPVPAAEEE